MAQNTIAESTYELLRVRIGLASSDTSRDSDLAAVWYQSRNMLAAYLNRSLYAGVSVDVFTCEAMRVFSLKAYPVNSVTSVITETGDSVADTLLSANNGLLYLPWANRAYQVTVTYDATPPDDDELMAPLLWGFDTIWNQRYAAVTDAGAATTIKTISVDGMRTEYFDPSTNGSTNIETAGGGYPSSIAAMLVPYRRENA